MLWSICFQRFKDFVDIGIYQALYEKERMSDDTRKHTVSSDPAVVIPNKWRTMTAASEVS
jgi:hypothetical protein